MDGVVEGLAQQAVPSSSRISGVSISLVVFFWLFIFPFFPHSRAPHTRLLSVEWCVGSLGGCLLLAHASVGSGVGGGGLGLEGLMGEISVQLHSFSPPPHPPLPLPHTPFSHFTSP